MIDLKKTYRCRDRSYEVEVFATDMGGRHPVLARVRQKGRHYWDAIMLTSHGCHASHTRYDLIEVSEDDMPWDEQFLRELGMREWFYCHDGVGGDETPFPPLETRKH